MLRGYQERAEARPDTFVRYEYRTKLLDESRGVIADYLNTDRDRCVFVPNATTGIETVLRNITFRRGDVIVHFSTLYEAVMNTVKFVVAKEGIESRGIEIEYPISDDALCEKLETTINAIQSGQKSPRIVIFDTISSEPGVRMPFERLTGICETHQAFSLIDGAHGVGQIPLNLSTLKPDFFVSNCHKWLHVPRSCAVLYVRPDHQLLLRETLPIGFGYYPRTVFRMPDVEKEGFAPNFASTGTRDDTPYLCVSAALEWRKKLSWGGKLGEEAIMAYNNDLARRGGLAVAAVLDTEVLQTDGTEGRCSMTNVRLPLSLKEMTMGNKKHVEKVGQWIMKTMDLEYNTAVYVLRYGDSWWVRLSAQVYLTMLDFQYAAEKLKLTCERAGKGEWKTEKK